MSGQNPNSGFGGNKGDPGSLTDPLSFASRLFQQIGNKDYATDDESRSESEGSESEQQSSYDDDEVDEARGSSLGGSTYQGTSSSLLHKIGQSLEDRSSTGQFLGSKVQTNHSAPGGNDDHIAKRMKLEAVVQHINAGMPTSAASSATAVNTKAQPTPPQSIVLTPETLSLFNLAAPGGSSPKVALPQSTVQTYALGPIHTPTPMSAMHMPISLHAQSTAVAPSSTKNANGGKVIDLTEEDPLTISDDEVVIDESKTTAIANRNMCFGMIQSLVVTLYPRHLEYIEGKADRVIIKRATTANKASLAVEHESGLVSSGYDAS
jgi:hypothetical protein